MKLLKAMYPDKTLSEKEVEAIVGPIDAAMPNERISFLHSEKLILIHIDGEPDGAGGYKQSTVTRTYSLSLRGKAAVEDERNHEKDKWLDRASNLLP